MSKKTVVIGASTNPRRTAYDAVDRLLRAGHEVVLIGAREGTVHGQPIRTGQPQIDQVDTATLYINPKLQAEYLDYLLTLGLRRVIFNPGTENPALAESLRNAGIKVENTCTLVRLAMQSY